jgi:uncharacterized protein with NRDE domain
VCLAIVAIDLNWRFPLVLAANRDEHFNRPAARLAWWRRSESEPAILGGRDLQEGGTWLGLTAQGRLALVTNVRGGYEVDPRAPSRGEIVPDWLGALQAPDKFWAYSALSGYNGFNMIAADFRQGDCLWASNLAPYPQRLGAGIYGLSNASLDTPWPKVDRLKLLTRTAVATSPSLEELSRILFEALSDRTTAADVNLPHTGISLELERALSASFIRTADGEYGTRCSTLVITERGKRHLITHVFERTYSPGSTVALMRHFKIKNWPPRYANDQLFNKNQGEDEGGPLKATRVRSLLRPTHK